jgi:tRNA modification GTPase
LDTIFSSATSSLKSAIKIIRISGKNCKNLPDIFSFKPTVPRYLTLRKIFDSHKKLIDTSLVVYIPGPSTVTGEDVFEFHIHGSNIIEKKIYETLLKHKGFRIAMNGEFTRRAFLNGKIDLTQAEGLNDLINAETEAQFQASINQYNGFLSDKVEKWRHEIISLSSKLEALIDFSDEELPSHLEIDFKEKVSKLIREKEESLKFSSYGSRIRSGFVVTLIGKPNVGKSSLINFLSKKQVSIVTNEAGTTRDIIEVLLDFKGYPVILNDTAGIRQSESEVENIGIKNAIDKANSSDIILLMSDKEDFSVDKINSKAKKILVHTKCDLLSCKKKGVIEVSTKREETINELIDVIVDHLESMSPKNNLILTRERHVQAVRNALNSLKKTLKINLNFYPELASEELRVAAKEIGSITNIIDVEDVLDDIFSNFCIGK